MLRCQTHLSETPPGQVSRCGLGLGCSRSERLPTRGRVSLCEAFHGSAAVDSVPTELIGEPTRTSRPRACAVGHSEAKAVYSRPGWSSWQPDGRPIPASRASLLAVRPRSQAMADNHYRVDEAGPSPGSNRGEGDKPSPVRHRSISSLDATAPQRLEHGGRATPPGRSLPYRGHMSRPVVR